jgi:hypothetical protein
MSKLTIRKDGSKYWKKGYKLHRLDGPAVEHPDGRKSWWIDGEHYHTQQEHAIAAFLWMNEYERT